MSFLVSGATPTLTLSNWGARSGNKLGWVGARYQDALIFSSSQAPISIQTFINRHDYSTMSSKSHLERVSLAALISTSSIGEGTIDSDTYRMVYRL